MKKGTRILTVLLSLAMMLTMVIPVAFAEDTAPTGDAETVQTESVDTVEAPVSDSAQTIDETTREDITTEEVNSEDSTENQDDISIEEISLDEEEITESKAKLAASNINRSILVAGLDNGKRADLILIVSFTADNKAKIFAVARDTYMQLNPSKKYNIDGKVRDFCKCNRASQEGSHAGLKVLMTELNRHLDLNITDYVGADWDCVATLIDNSAVGGLRVNLTDKNMVNAINELIASAGKGAKKVTTGSQTLTGWQAVEYLRVRKHIPTPEGKGARVREDRNRDVFIQLYNHLRKSDKKDLLYNAIAGKIVTSMSPTEIKALYDQFESITVEPATQYPYTSKMYWDKWADMYYLVPTTLEANTIKLHKSVLGQGSYNASATVKSLSATIAKHVKKKVIVVKKPKVPSIAKASVTIGPAAYTGKAVTPSVTVKLKKKKLKAGYYRVAYSNNVNIGKASVTITGMCGYGGTKTVTFDIKPAGTSLTGITAGSKSFTATWAQQAAKMPNKTVDGYQIQYGLKKNFKKAKTMTVGGYTNTTATVGKLKAKKKYYVRVRTYVGSGKSAVYSDWSAARVVKPTK